jgi:hypothetical protein
MTAIVKLFLESPGDVISERAVVRARAEHFNKMWSDEYQIYFRVVGWEDLPPVAQRPQSRINTDADDCHLFVGILASRWGSESGSYSSGFEEEFESAKRRFKLNGSPEIALFFKTIATVQIGDAGPQLSKVLQFRQSIVDGREFMFKEFPSPSELADFVDRVLAEYAKASRRRRAETLAVSTSQSSDVDATNLLDQSLSHVSSLIPNVLRETIELENGRPSELDFWSRLRLVVYSSAMYSGESHDRFLEVHEIQLSYRARTEWMLTNREQYFLFDSALSNKNYSPGWWWVAKETLEAIRTHLWLLCASGSSTSVVAAELLSSDTALPYQLDILERAMQDIPTAQHLSPLLGRLGTKEHLAILAKAKEAAGSYREQPFIIAEFDILSRNGETMSLQELSSYARCGVINAKLILRARIAETEILDIATLAANFPEADREPFLQACMEEGKLKSDLAEVLLGASNNRVREIGVRALISSGRPFSRAELLALFPEDPETKNTLSGLFNRIDTERMVKEGFNLLPYETLLELVEFFGPDGRLAFSVLCELHWPHYVGQVELQLDSEFEMLKDEDDKRSLLSSGFALTPMWSTNGTSLIEYIRSEFVEVALLAALRNRHARATEWGFKYLDSGHLPRTRAAALKVLLGLNIKFDPTRLLENVSGLPTEAAISLIQMMGSFNSLPGAIVNLAAHESAPGRSALRDALIRLWDSAWRPHLVELLNSKSDAARLIAAAVLSKVLPRNDLESILREYIEQPSYYYDVVTTWDRELYAPDIFRSHSLN